MSMTDNASLEDEDDELCSIHERYRPCIECRADEADRQYDTMKEAP